MGSPFKERNHALDGLRAVAACLVVAHHLGVSAFAGTLSSSGHRFLGNFLANLTSSGVELFFVLSGIVLARPYLRGERAFNVLSYFRRRVKRLMPPYVVAWLLAGLAIGLATAYPTWWTQGAALPTFSFEGWLSQIAIFYVGRAGYNFAWWSLTIEISFYAVLPFLIVPAARLRIRSMWIAYFGSLVAAVLLAPLVNVRILHELILYSSCFCAGLLLARTQLDANARLAVCVLGGMWLLAACRFEYLNPHVGWGMIYLGIAALAIEPRPPSGVQTKIVAVLSSYGFVWLGERSYSLFLVHYSVIGLVSHAASTAFPAKTASYFVFTRIFSVALAMLTAMLLFSLVERRFAHNLATGYDFLPRRAGALSSAY
jgi:peptidoglycan/LPS O-acetylase OafA/YrhL